MAESINDIKEYAKQVLILKEKTELLLEEIGISKEDAKRVVDYVNSLVKLTDSDKKEIREKVKEAKEETEEEVEEKMDKQPYTFTQYVNSLGGSNMANANWKANDLASSYTVSLGNSGINLKV